MKEPIRYRNYDITPTDAPPNNKWEFTHEDFDGAPDSEDGRYGWSVTVDDAIDQIDEIEDE